MHNAIEVIVISIIRSNSADTVVRVIALRFRATIVMRVVVLIIG